MVNLLLSPEKDLRTQPRRQDHLRPGLRHRRHALRGREVHPRPQRRRRPARSSARTGTTRPGPSASPTCSSRARTPTTSSSATPSPRTASTATPTARSAPSTTCWPIRPSAWSGSSSRRYIEKEARDARLRRPLRRRPAAHQRRLAALPQHMLSKMRAPEGGRQPHRHRLQRLAALHRRRRQRREQHPPLDHRERLAGGHRRPARPALLQHRHLHLPLGAHQPQGAARARARSSSSTPASFFVQDAEEPRQQAQPDRRPRTRSEPDQIGELTRIFGNFRDGETRTFTEEDPITSSRVKRERVVSKIFDNDDFGFHKITVERPLRLNFQASAERIARLDDESGFKNLATSTKKSETARQRGDRSRAAAAGRDPRAAPRFRQSHAGEALQGPQGFPRRPARARPQAAACA